MSDKQAIREGISDVSMTLVVRGIEHSGAEDDFSYKGALAIREQIGYELRSLSLVQKF